MSNHLSSKFFKVALASSLATGAFVATAPAHSDAANTKFKDLLPSNGHYEAVLELADRGIIKGFEDNTFKPNGSVTRGQAAKIIAMALELDTIDVKNPGFADVSTNHTYYGPIAALVNEGIITGFTEDNTFRPGDTLTRAQMSKILSLAFKLPEATEIDNTFTDVKPHHWYKGYVQTLVDLGITKGATATTFEPGSPVKRGQLASFIVRTESKVPDSENPIIIPTPGPVTEGNVALNSMIKSAVDGIDSSLEEKIDLTLNDKTIQVNIKDNSTTIGEFNEVSKPILDVFHTNTVVETAVITLVSPLGITQTISETAENNNGINLNDLLAKGMTKANISPTSPIAFLTGSTVSFTVTGTHDVNQINDVYYFKF